MFLENQISKGLCDQLGITGINYVSQYIKTETVILKCNNS